MRVMGAEWGRCIISVCLLCCAVIKISLGREAGPPLVFRGGPSPRPGRGDCGEGGPSHCPPATLLPHFSIPTLLTIRLHLPGLYPAMISIPPHNHVTSCTLLDHHLNYPAPTQPPGIHLLERCPMDQTRRCMSWTILRDHSGVSTPDLGGELAETMAGRLSVV